jgi:hypothetical protein
MPARSSIGFIEATARRRGDDDAYIPQLTAAVLSSVPSPAASRGKPVRSVSG